MNKTKKRSLALLLGMLAIGVSRSDAAEWTTTVDRYTTSSSTVGLSGEPAATAEALWIGPDRAFDPETGADLPPYALPERISLVDGQYGVSSQRGQLWKRYFFFDFMPYLQADADEGFWGMSGYGAAEGVHLAKDGAQVKRWTASDLGHADMHVIAVNPLLDDAGALVLIGNTSSALALQLDPRGQVMRTVTVPACSRQVADDRRGGIYALCPSDSPPGMSTLHHQGTGSRQNWSKPVADANLSRGGIGTDGAVLVLDSASYPEHWRSLDLEGNTRFSIQASSGIAVSDGYWFHQPQSSIFRRVSRGGTVLATVRASAAAYAAHSNGALVLGHSYRSSIRFSIYSASGSLLREFGSEQTPAVVTQARLSTDTASAFVQLDNGVAALDANGQPLVSIDDSFPGGVHDVLVDADHICVEGSMHSPIQYPLLRCHSRTTGIAIGTTNAVNVNLLHLQGTLIVDVVDALEVLNPDLTLVNRISLVDALGYDLHPTQGIAVVRTVGGVRRLQRHRLDCSLMFDVTLPATGEPTVVGVGSDGSTIVAGGLAPVTLLRYDAEGQLRAMRELPLDGAEGPITAAASSIDGVQLLQATQTERAPIHGRLTLLDAQLVKRGDVSYTSSTEPKLWPARAGAARFAYDTASGLIVQQFRPDLGQPIERRALAIDRNQGRFNIDSEGIVRAITFDAALGRDVLRISHPTPSAFTGPIRQSALTGSWYSPASTGQGLLLQLLNGNVLFGAWHTYAPEGGNALSKQQWFTVTGEVANERGRITLPIYRNGNGRFDTDGTTPSEAVGSAELVFTSCDQMEFWYRIGEDTGAFALQRLTPRTQACNDGSSTQPPLDAAKGLAIDGAWYVPSQSGQGLTFNTSGARFGSYLAGWFTYDTEAGVDDASAQHWFTLQGATPEHFGESVIAQIHRTLGGSRSGEPTRNTHRVGEATLTVHDCAHATLSYRFDDSVIAGSFANLQRSVPLQRLGACPD